MSGNIQFLEHNEGESQENKKYHKMPAKHQKMPTKPNHTALHS